jgi:FkbM family methyltransferase
MNALTLMSFIVRHPVNRQDRLGALSRFLRWQLASRIIGQRIALPFVENTALLTSTGMTGSTGNWYCGLHEPFEMGLVLHGLRAGDLFLDVGANVGSYSLLAGGAVGAHVIAVEPIPATFGKLLANIRLNDLAERIEARCCGLSDAEGELRFTSDDDTMNRIALPGEDVATVAVRVTTLDALCAGRVPAIIKIDVEGHERQVLAGGGETLGSPGVRAVLLETNGSGRKYGVEDAELVAVMTEHGFQAFSYDPFERRFSADRRGLNTIFLRDEEDMAAICKAAPRYTLVNGSI